MAQLTTSYQKIGTGSVKTFDATKARIDLYAKYNSQSIQNNNTEWQIEARLVKVSGGYIGEYTGTELKLSGDNISKTESLGTGNFDSRTLGNAKGTTGHNADGTKSVSASASMKFKAWGTTLTVSGSATLPTIPRYFTTTPNITLTGRTETTMTYAWSTSEPCSAIAFSGGGSYSYTGIGGTSGTVTVTGLSADTPYTHSGTFTRSDSGLPSPSNSSSNRTFPYPSCLSGSNFIIGENISISLNNPLTRSVSIAIYGNDNSLICSASRSINGNTSISNTPAEINAQYSSIPNSKSGTYKVSVTYNGITSTTTNVGTYTINESQCKPTFANTNYTYEDTNSNTTVMTGNNQILVDGYSIPKFDITTRATPVNYAGGISGYTCYWGNKFESYLEQDIGTYWSKQIPNTFTLSYNSNTKMNSTTCVGVAENWECLYFPVKTVSGQKYRLTFDYVNTNGYTPLSGYDGIPCQVLTKVENSNNLNNQIASVLLDPTASASTRNLTVNFTAVGATTYICFNFGCTADGTTTAISLGNFELDMVGGSGNYISIQATDTRQQSTYADKTITNIPYINATVNSLGTQRKDGVDTKTYLAGKFNIYNGSWDGTDNANSQNRLKYVGYSVYKNNTWSSYYDITTAVLNNATITTEGNIKTYTLNYDDEVQIHENGSSGGFTSGTEFPIKVLIKDGNSSTIFATDYQATGNTDVSDGTVATSLHKDSNGNYHYSINAMSEDDYTLYVNGNGKFNKNVEIGEGTATEQNTQQITVGTRNELQLKANSEGGNIRLENPNITNSDHWEMDAYDGNFRIYHGDKNTEADYTYTFDKTKGGTVATTNNIEIYSTSEKRVGTWINGKPIYRKVYDFGTISEYQTTNGTPISNLDKLIRIYGSANATFGQKYGIPNVHSDMGNYHINALLTNSTYVTVRKGTGYATLVDVYVTVEYTKTTD